MNVSPPDYAERQPQITITRSGRWTYHVKLTDGLTLVGDWLVFGAKGARRVGWRKLRRYRRARARREVFGTEELR